MAFIRNCMLLVLMLGAAAITRANDYELYGLTLCNSGELKFDVAVAAKVPGGWFSSDKWSVYGWIPIEPKKCKQVYHDETWGLVRDLAVHVAVVFTDSTGVWGDAQLQFKDKDRSSYQFCGSKDDFGYEHQTPYSCVGGQFMIPASVDYDGLALSTPEPMRINGTAVYGWPQDNNPRIELTSKNRAKPIKGASSAPGPGSSASNSTSASASDSSGPSIGTALGVLGALVVGATILADAGTPPKPFESGTLNAVLLEDKIVRRSGSDKWYFADGSPVPTFYHLEGRAKSYLLDAPLQRSVSDPGVVEAKKALQQGLGDWSRDGHIELLPVGRLYYSYVKNPQHDLHRQTVNLVSLDFTRASQEHDASGQTWLRIPCKGNQACNIGIDEDSAEHFSNDEIYSDFYLYFTGTQNAEAIWNALLNLRDLYPAEPTVVAR
jgi:hypothetical protein